MANDGAVRVEGIDEAVITDESPRKMKIHDV
jgi:hypothetical protein